MHADTHDSATPAPDTDKRKPNLARSGSGYITLRDITADTGLSAPTIWRMRKRGKFPQPVRLSPGRSAWTIEVYQARKDSL